MHFLYTGIAYGPNVNKNAIYTDRQLVHLIVYTIKQLYHSSWDITIDEINHLSKIDLNNIQDKDVLYCQELCGADIVTSSRL